MANDAAISIALKFLDQATAPMQSALSKIESRTKAMESMMGIAAKSISGMFAASLGYFSVDKLMAMGKEYETAVARVKNVFQDGAESAIQSLEMISSRSGKLFDFPELARGASRIEDTFDTLNMSGEDLTVMLTRVTDIARAKGIDLEEAIAKTNMAMSGAAKAGRAMGVVLTDNYMQYTAFGGALKDVWSKLSDSDKYWWRYQEFLQQSDKYAGMAEKTTGTLSSALKALSNTLADRLEPALAAVCGWLAKYVNLARQAISPESLSSQIQVRMQGLASARSVGMPGPNGEIGMDMVLKQHLGEVPGMAGATAAQRTQLLSMYAALRGERAAKEMLQPPGLTAAGTPVGAEEHVTEQKTGAAATGGAGRGGGVDQGMREYQRLMEEGTRITEQNYTETEKYNAELEKLNYLRNYGALSEEAHSRAIEDTWTNLVKANAETEGWKEFYSLQEESAKIVEATRTEAEKYSAELDRLSYLLGYGVLSQETYNRAVEAAGEKFNKTTDEMSEFAVQAAHNIQDALGKTLKDVLKGDFENIGDAFGDMLADMAAQAMAAEIGKLLFGNFGKSGEIGGLAGGLISFVGGLFGGGMASGGSVSPGRTYLVGEKGPELFTPGSGGNITPNAQLSGPPSVSVNIRNETGSKVDAEQGQATFNGESWVANVTLKLAKNSPSYRNQMRQLLGR